MNETNRHGKRGRRVAVAGAAGVLAVLAVLPASAAQQRSFVASTGHDSALCTLASPCRSFTVAIAATNSGGEVVVLDSAGYGPVNIIKPISLIAPAGVYAGISVTTGDGVTIDAPGATVVLRGLAINGQGGTHGVRVHAGARVRIENCVVSSMDQDGIHHEASGAELVVLDTIVRDNGNFGINLIADASVVLDHVRSEHNETSGLRVGAVASETSAAVSDSLFSHNGGHGILAVANNGQTTRLKVDRSVVANNTGSGIFATAVPSSEVIVGLASSSVSGNGADGVTLSGTEPTGLVMAMLSANSVTDNGGFGLFVHARAIALAAANAVATNGQSDFRCVQGSSLETLGNNLVLNFGYDNGSGCHSVLMGQ